MERSSPMHLLRLTRCQPAVALFLAAAILAPPKCATQVSGTLEFSPVVGAYHPTTELSRQRLGSVPEVAIYQTRQNAAAAALGGRLTAWANRWIAFEGSAWYAWAPVIQEVTSSWLGPPIPPERLEDAPGGVVGSDVRLLVCLPPVAGMRVFVVGGGAFVSHGGDGAGWGGVVGAGSRLRVARSLALRAELAQYLYSVQGLHQRDLVVSLGLSYATRISRAAAP